MTELPDRLLRDALHDTASTTASPMCVDVEALAAWADGTMSAADRGAFEDHAAGCARCLALVAAMARSQPPPVALAWWRRSPFAWLVPLATAAAVVAAAVVVDLGLPRQPSPPPTAVVQSAPSAAVVPPPAEVAPSPDRRAPLSSASPAKPRRQERAAIDATQSQALAANRLKSEAAASVAPTRERSTAEPEAKDAAVRPAPVAATPPPAAPAAAPTAAPSALRDELVRREAARIAAAPMLKAAAAAVPVVIASPDRDVQWRIVAGVVEHTADGGVTWQPQPLGIAASIRAGSAPTARVCWLAGAGGVVLRTTDGATWVRIAFPEPTDLTDVQAGDAAHATVITQAGATFATSDGGRTWIRQ